MAKLPDTDTWTQEDWKDLFETIEAFKGRVAARRQAKDEAAEAKSFGPWREAIDPAKVPHTIVRQFPAPHGRCDQCG
jgi:hypothetical protein